MKRPDARIVLLIVLLIAGVAMTTATRRTSTTFDEIVMIAAGARGYETGRWDMAREHPPLVQYLYGLPVHLSGASLPDEQGVDAAAAPMMHRYTYAQRFFWLEGNDPERLAFLGRLPATAMALLLALSAFLYTRRGWGDGPAVLAATLVAFLPDVLAHGGVAYNDVPVALAFFLAAWSIDATVREPTPRRGLVAGFAVALALAAKNSAIALAPLALALLLAEAIVRRAERGWVRRIAIGTGTAIVAAYVTLVLIYRGDVLLEEYRYGLSFVLGQVDRATPAFLLGDRQPGGWWYYFPVAFVLKTSAGFHLLLILAAVSLVAALRAAPARTRTVRVLASHLRMPVLAALILGLLFLQSRLNIGFRYALPVLAPLAVIAAVGAARAWRSGPRIVRGAVAAGILLATLHPLSYWPHFLAYVSEYGPGRDLNHRLLSDSSLDWGQGLLELRDWMRAEGVERVYLSYFGSALPAGYGIDYVPLASFFPLPQANAAAGGAGEGVDDAEAGARPTHVAISATNLVGTYFTADPLRSFREIPPDAVLGHTIFVYRIGETP